MTETRKLRDVCLGIFDGPHATPPRANQGPVFLGISSLNNGRLDLSEVEYIADSHFARWTRRVTPRPGDLVFSYETRLGQAALIPEGLRCCLGRRLGLLRPDPTKLDPRFLLYSYIGPDFQEFLETRVLHGSTVDRLPIAEFPDFPILVPPLPEQNAVASVLGSLDDKIELNRRTNQSLEDLASALFKSWFVDFDPVIAKRDGKTPVGVPADAVNFFPSHFEDSELGPIPKGWRVAHVEEVFDLNPRRNLSPGVVAPYLEMANVPTVGHSPDTWIMRKTGSGMRFTNGDTLMARITPCLENGKTAFVDFLAPGEIGWGSTEFLVMRSKHPLTLIASYLLARDDGLRAYAIQGMTGSSGRQRVAADVLGRYAFAMPDDKVAKAFGDIVEPLFEMARHNSAESKTLRDIRDVLLAPLLSGEIALKAAEKTVAEVI